MQPRHNPFVTLLGQRQKPNQINSTACKRLQRYCQKSSSIHAKLVRALSCCTNYARTKKVSDIIGNTWPIIRIGNCCIRVINTRMTCQHAVTVRCAQDSFPAQDVRTRTSSDSTTPQARLGKSCGRNVTLNQLQYTLRKPSVITATVNSLTKPTCAVVDPKTNRLPSSCRTGPLLAKITDPSSCQHHTLKCSKDSK